MRRLSRGRSPVVRTSATVMLSGPPLLFACSTSARGAIASGVSRMTLTMSSGSTGSVKPSEHSTSVSPGTSSKQMMSTSHVGCSPTARRIMLFCELAASSGVIAPRASIICVKL